MNVCVCVHVYMWRKGEESPWCFGHLSWQHQPGRNVETNQHTCEQNQVSIHSAHIIIPYLSTISRQVLDTIPYMVEAHTHTSGKYENETMLYYLYIPTHGDKFHTWLKAHTHTSWEYGNEAIIPFAQNLAPLVLGNGMCSSFKCPKMSKSGCLLGGWGRL